MPRVTTHTASNRGKTYTCTGCGKPIEAGERYYLWTRRVGPKAGYRRHVACGPPRPTELTSRKTAQVDEAVMDYAAPDPDYSVLNNVPDEVEHTVEFDTVPFEDAVAGVADTAEEVGQEYESSADGMPENLQYGEQAEMMRDVASRLQEWADELREKASEGLEVDLPVKAKGASNDWRADAEEAVDTAWQERVSELDDLMGEVPEYEG